MSCHCNKSVACVTQCAPQNNSYQLPNQVSCQYFSQQNRLPSDKWSGNSYGLDYNCDKCKHRKCKCGRPEKHHDRKEHHQKNRCDKCELDNCGCDETLEKRDRCGKCNLDNCDCDRASTKRDRCNKCKHNKCRCVEIFPSLRVKCGCVSASLTKTASVNQVSGSNQLIVYTYTITNTGSVPLCYPIEIFDDQLGSQFVSGCYITPGDSQDFTRTYTTLISDLSAPIVNNAIAYIQVKRNKWVATNTSTATIVIGGSDLTGQITQSIVSVTETTAIVNVNVVINNLSSSLTPATGVTLPLLFPFNITNVTPLTSNIILGVGTLTINIPTISIGQAVLAQFTYTAPRPASYTWTGTIRSTSFNPNPANTLTSTISLS